MTILSYDDFTGSGGAPSALRIIGTAQRTTASGHVWEKDTTSTNAVLLTGSGTAYQDALGGGGGGFHMIVGSGAIATTDGEKCTATLDIKSVGAAMGPGCRLVNGAQSGYVVIYFSGEWRLYRFIAGSAALLAQSGATTPSTGAHTLSIQATNSGANVLLDCVLDGSALFGGTVTDTSPGILTTFGYGGFYSDTAYSTTTGIHLDYIQHEDAGGGGGTPTGLSTETDTALALTAKQIKPAGLATETDTALALTTAAGFDFHTAAGLIFGDLAGALTSLAREAAVDMVLRVYGVASPGALVVESGTLTTDSNGRLARFEHASLSAGTAYHCVFIRASDGEIVSTKLTAT